eukprot:11338202-Heterocapsa_arctica.AAC.1
MWSLQDIGVGHAWETKVDDQSVVPDELSPPAPTVVKLVRRGAEDVDLSLGEVRGVMDGESPRPAVLDGSDELAAELLGLGPVSVGCEERVASPTQKALVGLQVMDLVIRIGVVDGGLVVVSARSADENRLEEGR